MSAASRRFWQKREMNYPYKIEVPHMCKRDINPGVFKEIAAGYFLRVPFDGIAHWGFTRKEDRDMFLEMGRKA